ncbi:MAG: sphingosine kinase [Gemmatimonadaceae bacterium]|nr:sphingosine kinase [Gemmatimonadaceae bacterium]
MTRSRERIAVILNAGSGDGSAEATEAVVGGIFRDAGFDARFTILRGPDDLTRAIDAAIADGVTIVVAGGGDGTVNSVANAIHGHDLTLGVLPLGTLNHFAKDLGIPVVTEEAAAVIVAGKSVLVDVGDVNGRVFLNNSSLGLYPRIVQLRERYKARGIEKWIVAAWATMRVTRQQKPMRMQLVVDGHDVVRSTPLLFVGNNEYRMSGFEAGSRESLTAGKLALYLVKAEGRWRLITLVWRILTGTATESGEMAMASAAEATIDLPFDVSVTQLAVAVDGEVTTLSLPLRYSIRPASLRVLVPA